MENREVKRERSGSRDRDRSRRNDRQSNSGGMRDRSPISKKSGGVGDRRVYVSNIAYDYRWQELKDLFREKVGEVAFVELFVDENDKPRGCGIVEFHSPELAQKAVEKMHRYELKGRKLVVKENFDVERDKQGRPVGFGGRSVRSTERGGGGGGSMNNHSNWNEPPMNSQGGGNKYGNTYGLSPSFLESLWIQGPLTNKIFVANLDYKVDEKRLREVFKLAGKIVDCDLSVDKDGKSRGFAVIEYDHPVEAVQAISMLHNQVLFDRRLIVRLDRVDKEGPSKLPEGLKGIGMGLGANGAPLTDVARNLPNLTQPTITAQTLAQTTAGVPSALAALGSNPAVALAAANQLQSGQLGGLSSISNLIGAAAASNTPDLTSALISNNYTGSLAGLASGNPAASALSNSLLTNSAAFGGAPRGVGGLGSGSGRDFESLSAAFSNAEGDYRRSSGHGAGHGSVFSSSLSGALDRGNGLNDGLLPSRRTDTVVVSNLPAATTWQLLKDKFCSFGDIKFAEMRGKDYGIIRFSNEWEAERAINMMDRARFDGRTISVQYF